ncbi:ABC-F type ribosomal protection protein [Heliobacterium undosum]|uniref:ABC-F type ribosomal protection protein n=1 Tax=Heliomicrobium undosum TaxID=121734 RepID=A0A845L9M6_9FIRM|nr:ABC-F type ribosomal protection protein [Heliomicrobium undosum]MZP30408.1 ABC-F type ribosomal protection protein [Heliomicrobium undosum]
MLAAELCNLKKYFGDRLILAIDELKIYRGDRIGVVGRNGAGKSTFLRILEGRLLPEEGLVKGYAETAVIEQMGNGEMAGYGGCHGGCDGGCDGSEETLREPDLSERLLRTSEQADKEKRFQVRTGDPDLLSGGEVTRRKIAVALGRPSGILLADEPTANLDMAGTQLLQAHLLEYDGAVLLVSHDRELLDQVCNRILEIENGCVRLFDGNYTDYRKQKQAEAVRRQAEYEAYVQERERLEAAMREKSRQAKAMRSTPSRMGNSEARLHKRGVNSKRAKLDRGAQAIESRLERLEKKEKPEAAPGIVFDRPGEGALPGKIAIRVENLTKRFGERLLFQGANFEVARGRKIALAGDNGSGKTTLLKMILARETGVTIHPAARIGFFDQKLERLREDRTVLETLRALSDRPESFVRTLLARLNFRRDDAHKQVAMLSGGERVKLSLAMTLVQDFNVLLLDEPTNYLDIDALEALESLLREYPGTILFVSHDRRLVDRVADQVLWIEGGRVTACQPSRTTQPSQSPRSQRSSQPSQTAQPFQPVDPSPYGKAKRTETDISGERLRLECRMADLLGRLSMPRRKGDEQVRAQWEAEYRDIVAQSARLRKEKSFNS